MRDSLPPRSDDEALSAAHFAWRQGDLRASEEKVLDTLKEFNNVSQLKGWIPERFNEVAGEKFRFVHIVVDLYEPTKDSIEFFYSRMSSGGVMIFDDYGMTSCPGAYKAITEFMRDRPEHVIHLPTAQGIVIKV